MSAQSISSRERSCQRGARRSPSMASINSVNHRLPCPSAAQPYADLLCKCCLFVALAEGRDHPRRQRQRAVKASSAIIGRETLNQAPLSLGSNGGKDDHTSGRYHAYDSVRRCGTDRERQRRCIGERALEKYALEPDGCAAERQHPDYRIFFVVSATPFRALLDRVVLLLVPADRAIL